jgi:Carboxypeptidase regulatory-like domain
MVVITAWLVALAIGQGSPTAESVGRLAGRVTVEGTNTPIASARVILLPGARPAGPFGPPPQTTTDQDGRFAFNRIAPGDYRVEAQKSGFAPVSDANPSRTVHVAAGQAIDDLEVHLQKGAAISGRLVDASGEPVADARVMAMRRLDQRGVGSPRLMPAGGPSQQTNDLGEFRVSGLPPGEYVIAAVPQGAFGAPFGGPGTPPPARASQPRTTTTTTFYPGTTDQAAAQPIAVAAGAEVGNITFTMQSAPAFRVSGIVVDENGNPVAGAMVMLMGDPRSGMFLGPAGNGHSQDDGRFVIEGVTPGNYRVNASVPMRIEGGASAGAFMTWSTGGGRGEGMPAPTEVVVSDANVTGVRVVVRRPS